jgi:CSLREA domain-containing protein
VYTTGSRSNSLGLRLTLVGIVAAFAVSLFALHARNAHAVTATVVTVNSTANTDDGICSGPPNAGTGNCTLREAIYTVNAGQADTIKFHPTIFSKATPGVINLESGFGDLPTITREVTIDGTGAGVIIDGDGGGTGDPADNATPCSAANLASGLDAHGNPARPCSRGLEVSANHNNFGFTLLGNGGQNFVIQHICASPTAGCGTRLSGQHGNGAGILLCGGDTTVAGTAQVGSGTPNCDMFSLGTVHIDGVDVTDAAYGVWMEGSNLVDVSVTNSLLSGNINAVFGVAQAGLKAIQPCSFVPTTPVTPAINCLRHNSVTLDHNGLNSFTGDSVVLEFIGDKDANSSVNAVITNNTFKSDETSVDIVTLANYSEHSSYNIDINHNSDMHAASAPAIIISENVFTFADYVTSTISISDNGNITGGITSAAGAPDTVCAAPSAAGLNGCGDSCDIQAQNCAIAAIDAFVGIQGGHSHSTSDITIDRNGNITGSGTGVSVSNFVCCGSANHAGTEISDNANIKGLGGDGIDVTNRAFDDGSTSPFVGDNGSSQVTINHNASIEGGGSDGLFIDSRAGADGGNGDENTANTAVTNNGPIRSRGVEDAVRIINYAYSNGGIGDDNTATTHVTGNGPIQSVSRNGVVVDNEAGNVRGGGGFEGNGNTATIDVGGNGGVVGNNDGVDTYNQAGSVNTGPGDHNSASTMIHGNGNVTGSGDEAIYSGNYAGVYSGTGPGDHNTSSAEINGNGNLNGGDADGVDSYVYSGGSGANSDSNTASNTIHDNGNITGVSGDGTYQETVAGDLAQNFGGDHNSIDTEAVHNGEVRGMGSSSGDGVDMAMFAGGGTVDSLDNHTVTKVNQNGAIVGETEDGIELNGLFNLGNANGAWVCCDAADTNNVDITGNTGGILGQGGNGININGICCSVNIVAIMNNTGGPITGLGAGFVSVGAAYGIGYEVNGSNSSPGCACFVDVNGNGFPDAIEHSVNDLIVSGNDISGSAEDGIHIASGAFDASMVNVSGVGKSIIQNNTINNNGENGVYLDTVQGLNIGPNNTISGNGFASDTNVHAGIQIVNALSDCWVGTTCQTSGAIYLPAGGNRITQNSIYNNHNAFTDDLGIDLNPENPGVGTDGLRIGCRTKGNPIDPNNCIQAPVINLIAEGGIVGGTTCALCTVEVFVADPNPHDQPLTVAAIQHGEGKTYLASGTADSSGNYQVHLPCGLAAGDLTATSTNKVKDTSEFSENHPFLGTGVCATATSTASNTPVPPTATNTVVPPTPTLTPVPKACGDVNDDGHVNAVDAQLILQLSAGLITTLPNMPSADVNHSGAVNPVDSALILQVEAGLIPQSSLHCT